MTQIIYADNAATTRLDISAFEAMKPFFLENYANASQPYSFSRSVKDALKESRRIIADCINADPEEIYFTSGGTESDNWALKGSLFQYGKQFKLLTSQIEHHAILNSCLEVETMGYTVSYLPVDNKGVVNPIFLRKYNNDKVGLVSVMLSNNEVGSVQPIKELATIAHQQGSLFHTDAVQAVGHIPVDVKELDVDLLSASAHKFNGPKGIGFLYIKKGTHLKPFMNGGAQEAGKRAGTENVPAIVGMAAALKDNCRHIDKYREYLFQLENQLLSGLTLAGLDFIRNGAEDHVPGNISISFKNLDGEMLFHRLDLMGICVSTGSACDSKNTQISHVISAMQIPMEYAKGTIRISLGKYNTSSDIEGILNALKKIIR